MPDLDACYFCGAVDGVTRETVGSEATTAPPTVALCPSCRDRLNAIVDQLTASATTGDDTAKRIDIQPGGTTEPDDADHTADTPPVAGDDDPPDKGVTVDPATDEESSATEQASDDRPPGYGKVLRFLRNRELPMARTTVVELVGSAYELRHDEVETALDYAIDNDTLREENDEIRRP